MNAIQRDITVVLMDIIREISSRMVASTRADYVKAAEKLSRRQLIRIYGVVFTLTLSPNRDPDVALSRSYIERAVNGENVDNALAAANALWELIAANRLHQLLKD